MKFIADGTLGKLIKYLRMLGYDTVYFKQNNTDELIRMAHEQGRILLTRKPGMKEKVPIKGLLLIAQNNPKKQLEEVINHFNLSPDNNLLLNRCLECNQELIAIKKKDAEGKVPEHILNSYATFSLCPLCKRIFWPGSHYEKMLRGFMHSTSHRQ